MNIFTREFTEQEKILLMIFGIVIILSAYYLLVYKPVESNISASRQENRELEDDLELLDSNVERISEVSKGLSPDSLTSYMPSYSSEKKELVFLHEILSGTEDYRVKFTGITREGNQIRREFAIRFTAKDYGQTEDVIEKLEDGEIRCLIRNIYAIPDEDSYALNEDSVIVNLTGTFYETMQGGVADKELPKDSSKNG